MDDDKDKDMLDDSEDEESDSFDENRMSVDHDSDEQMAAGRWTTTRSNPNNGSSTPFFDSDDGVFRCGDCGYEVADAICISCGEEYPDYMVCMCSTKEHPPSILLKCPARF